MQDLCGYGWLWVVLCGAVWVVYPGGRGNFKIGHISKYVGTTVLCVLRCLFDAPGLFSIRDIREYPLAVSVCGCVFLCVSVGLCASLCV